jgi:hypothetical protein
MCGQPVDAAICVAERTERAIEACYDAVLAPAEWSHALQLLAESLGAKSCTLFSDDEEAPPKMPISSEHAELWLRNEADAPDPHTRRGPAFRRAGYTTLVEDQISPEEERRTLPYYQEIARPGARDWYASTPFMVDQHRWACRFTVVRAAAGSFSRKPARAPLQANLPFKR